LPPDPSLLDLRTAKVEDRRVLKAMNQGDRERLRATLSDDPNAVHIGTHPAEWWNGVVTREGDEWTLVHSHASIGLPNDKLFG
jgi:hypothetical protein